MCCSRDVFYFSFGVETFSEHGEDYRWAIAARGDSACYRARFRECWFLWQRERFKHVRCFLGCKFVECRRKPFPRASQAAGTTAVGLTLHPYDLLKNPYQAKEKLVLLDLNSRPVLYDGAVIQYSGPVNPAIGARFGLMALRLDRMADENVALYNIMGIEAGESDGDTLGQLAVVLPEGTTELRLDRNWMVEPLGPLKGTNYVGADIQIPAVRFWRYVGNGGESTELTVPPQSHGTPGEPVDWQPDGPPPPPGPDAQRLSILGLKGGITKQQAFNLLANAGFTADGCEDKGNGYQWCTNIKDGTRGVKTVFFRDELEHIDYTFPDSEYTALRKSYLDLSDLQEVFQITAHWYGGAWREEQT